MDMQVPGNYLQPNVLATTRLSPFNSVSPRRNGSRVRDRAHTQWQAPISPPPAPTAPALHPLVYAQQLGWSGIPNPGDNNHIQAQNQGSYGQVYPTSVSPPAFPPVPPLATTVPTYPFGSFPYYGGNFLAPPAPQLHQQAANSVIRQQDLAAYPTQFFHPQAAYQQQLLVPVFVQSQNPSPTTEPAQSTEGATEQKDPFVYVQPPSDALDSERGRELYRRPPKTRIRVAQACEPCRKRKSKCSGARPRCKRCDKKNLECVYIEDHRANRLRDIRSRMVSSVPVTELDEDYDGDSTLPPCPPAGPSYSSSSAYSCSSGYSSSGSPLDSALPPPSSRSSTSEIPGLPYPIYVPPRIPPLPGPPSRSQSGTGTNDSAQSPPGVGSSTAISRALDLANAQTSVPTKPTTTGSGLTAYQHTTLHPQQGSSCVPDLSNLGSQQAQNMQSTSCLPPPRGLSGMSRPHSTSLTQDMYHASMNPSRGLGRRLAAVAKEMEVPLMFAPPPPLGRDRSSSSSSHPQGARSGAQTPTDYFSIPLAMASRSSSGTSQAQQPAHTVQSVPPPMQTTKSDGVASGLAQISLESMASGGVPLPGSLVSAMSGQDWEGGYGLEYGDWFHPFAEGLPDSLPSGGELSFYR